MLLPRPGFPLYDVLCQYHGVEIRYYDLLPQSGWEIDVTKLAGLVDGNTRALLINNPSNPCGAVYSRAHLTQVLAAAERLRLPIIADEVYSGMSFGEPFVQCAEVTTTVPVLSVCALSKKWLAPGWRVGWIVVHDANRILADAGVPDALLKLCQVTLGPPSLLQAAVPEIVLSTPQDWRPPRALPRTALAAVHRSSGLPAAQRAVLRAPLQGHPGLGGCLGAAGLDVLHGAPGARSPLRHRRGRRGLRQGRAAGGVGGRSARPVL